MYQHGYYQITLYKLRFIEFEILRSVGTNYYIKDRETELDWFLPSWMVISIGTRSLSFHLTSAQISILFKYAFQC